MLASPGDLVSADRVCTELSQRHPASKAVSSAEDTGPRPPPQPPAPQLGCAGPGTTHRAGTTHTREWADIEAEDIADWGPWDEHDWERDHEIEYLG